MRTIRETLLPGGLLVAAVLLAATTPAAAAPIGGKAGAPRGLAHVPGDAVLFLHLNLSELKKNKTFQLFRQSPGKGLPALWPDFVARDTGVTMDEAAGLTLVVLGERPDVILIATEKPYDRKRVLRAVFGEDKPAEITHKGKKIYCEPRPIPKDSPLNRGGQAQPRRAAPSPWSSGVCFLDEHTFVRGRVRALSAFIDEAGKEKDGGPLSAAVQQVASTPHHISAGVQLSLALRQEIERDSRQLARRDPIQAAVLYNLKPLLRLKTATAVGSLGEQTRVKVRVQFSTDDDAKAAREAARFGIKLVGGMLGFVRDALATEAGIAFDPASRSKPSQLQLWAQLEKGLSGAAIKQDGKELLVEAEAKTEHELVRAVVVEIVPKVRQAAWRIQSMNNLKQMGLALHNFQATHKWFPLTSWQRSPTQPPKAGAGLSWRVAILPYVEQADLYKQFKFDEPWDSAHNKKLIAKMPKIFAPPGREAKKPGLTHYRVFTGRMAPFHDRAQRGLTTIRDGTSNTFMVVEAAEPVIWTKPDELEYDPKKPVPKLGGIFAGGFHACFCDGSVRFFKGKLSEDVLRAYITANGGEVIRDNRDGPSGSRPDVGIKRDFEKPPIKK